MGNGITSKLPSDHSTFIGRAKNYLTRLATLNELDKIGGGKIVGLKGPGEPKFILTRLSACLEFWYQANGSKQQFMLYPRKGIEVNKLEVLIDQKLAKIAAKDSIIYQSLLPTADSKPAIESLINILCAETRRAVDLPAAHLPQFLQHMLDRQESETRLVWRKICELVGEVPVLQQKNDWLTAAVAEKRGLEELAYEEISKLKQLIDQKEEHLDELHRKAAENSQVLGTQVRALSHERDELSDANTTAQYELDRLVNLKLRFEREISELRNDKKRLEAQLASVSREPIRADQSILSRLRGFHQFLTMEAARMAAEQADTNRAISETTDRLAELERQQAELGGHEQRLNQRIAEMISQARAVQSFEDIDCLARITPEIKQAQVTIAQNRQLTADQAQKLSAEVTALENCRTRFSLHEAAIDHYLTRLGDLTEFLAPDMLAGNYPAVLAHYLTKNQVVTETVNSALVLAPTKQPSEPDTLDSVLQQFVGLPPVILYRDSSFRQANSHDTKKSQLKLLQNNIDARIILAWIEPYQQNRQRLSKTEIVNYLREHGYHPRYAAIIANALLAGLTELRLLDDHYVNLDPQILKSILAKRRSSLLARGLIQ